MAIVLRSTKEIRELAAQFDAVRAKLELIATALDDLRMPVVEVQDGTLRSVHLLYITDWVEAFELDAKKQSRSWANGVETRSAVQRRYNAKRKQASAPPPSELPAKKPSAKRKTKDSQ